MHRLPRLRSITALATDHSFVTAIRVAAGVINHSSPLVPATHTFSGAKSFAKWSADPLLNPWGRGRLVQPKKRLPDPRQAPPAGGQQARTGKGLKAGSAEWRRRMAAMKQGVTVSSSREEHWPNQLMAQQLLPACVYQEGCEDNAPATSG